LTEGLVKSQNDSNEDEGEGEEELEKQSGYMLFEDTYRSQIVKTHPNLSSLEVNNYLQKLWTEVPENEKKMYSNSAEDTAFDKPEETQGYNKEKKR